MRFQPMIESMESRQLFSGHGLSVHLPTSVSTDATVTADLAQLKTDQQQYATDRQTFAKTLAADAKAYRDAVKTLLPTLQPQEDQYNTDVAAYVSAEKSNGQAKASVAAQYSTVFQTDRAAINSATTDSAKAAAKSQFNTDKAAFQAALTLAQSSLQSLRDALKTDRQSLVTAITTDPTVAATLAKYLADASTRSTTLSADLKLTASAKLQLATDKKAASDASDGSDGTSDSSGSDDSTESHVQVSAHGSHRS